MSVIYQIFRKFVYDAVRWKENWLVLHSTFESKLRNEIVRFHDRFILATRRSWSSFNWKFYLIIQKPRKERANSMLVEYPIEILGKVIIPGEYQFSHLGWISLRFIKSFSLSKRSILIDRIYLLSIRLAWETATR